MNFMNFPPPDDPQFTNGEALLLALGVVGFLFLVLLHSLLKPTL